MLETFCRFLKILLPAFVAAPGTAVPAQTGESPLSGVEEILHTILVHDNLADGAFLNAQMGMQLQLRSDQSGDLRGVLLKAPSFAFASGFSYTIRRDPRSPDDEVRLGFLFLQCPDEAKFVHDWRMPLEHLQLPDGSGSIARFTPANGNSIAFSLIYQNLSGLCEAELTQTVTRQTRQPRTTVRPDPERSRHLAQSFARLMQTGDLRQEQNVGAALGMKLRRFGFHSARESAGHGQLLSEQAVTGIDGELFSYAIQDEGWQAIYPFAAEPEILVNRNVTLHIPLDTQTVCLTGQTIAQAIARAGVQVHRTMPGRRVVQWQAGGANTISLLATLQGNCIEAVDINQLTDTAHALPETPIFKLPASHTPAMMDAGDHALVARVAYRLRNEPNASLDFIAQLPATAGLSDFERMDAWMAKLKQAFTAYGIAESAMEFHLYPPAAAGTPPRVFLVALRRSAKCTQDSADSSAPEPALPFANPCH